ncbi:MAG: cyclic nucleotide-binding domain-containing protein [Cellvibrionaceae bacterium]
MLGSNSNKKGSDRKGARQNLTDLLVTMPLFDKLNVDELTSLRRYVSMIEVPAGDIVFQEGDPGNYVCFVAEGKLTVFKKGFGDEKTVLATIPSGRCIGEMALVDQFARSASAVAKVDSRLIVLSRENFDDICEHHPKLANKVLREIARLVSLNLRKTSANLVNLSSS